MNPTANPRDTFTMLPTIMAFGHLNILGCKSWRLKAITSENDIESGAQVTFQQYNGIR